MTSSYKIAVALFAGAVIGGGAIHALHAQAKPPVYVVAEVDVSNPEAYAKEYVPKAMAVNKAAGVRYLALGGKVTTLDGPPIKSRIVIQVWDSLEKAQAVRRSEEFKEARKIGDKYAKFRSFAIEGVPQ